MRYRMMVTVMLALLCAAPAGAAVCTLDDSVVTCQQKVAAELGIGTQAEMEEEVAEEVATKNTGAADAVTPAAGTKEDFSSSVLQFLLDSGAIDGSQDEDTGAFALDVTNFLGLDARHGYKAQFIGREAELFKGIEDAIDAAIPEAERAQRIQDLEKGLNRFSDTSLVLSFNPTGQKKGRGRNPDNYEAEYDLLWNELKAKFAPETAVAFKIEDAVLAAIQGLPMSPEERENFADGKTTFRQALGDTPVAAGVVQLVEASATSFYERSLAVETAIEGPFRELAKLIDNQPQWVASLEQTYRDPLVGPDELEIEASYEYGFANVAALNSHCKQRTDLATCLAEFVALDEGDRGARVNAGHRLAFSIGYSDVDDYDLDPGDDLDPVQKEGDHLFEINLGYSRYLNIVSDKLGANTRFDLTYSYEDTGSDPDRNDRHIGQAILSIPAREGTFFTVGIKYASDPKFLGEVDEELSARVGLIYKPFVGSATQGAGGGAGTK